MGPLLMNVKVLAARLANPKRSSYSQTPYPLSLAPADANTANGMRDSLSVLDEMLSSNCCIKMSTS
jgi:hypothetical protein